MSETIAIPGVVEVNDQITVLLDVVDKELQKLDAVGPLGCQFLAKFGVRSDREQLEKVQKSLQRCRDLAKDYRVVRRDLGDTRAVKDTHGNTIKIPLVFATKLPAKGIVQFTHGHSRISAQTPMPPAEVGHAIAKHRTKFDYLEVWWVPNDVLVAPIPKPDPLLVGYVAVPETDGFYFELHRWIDETVEVGYWAKEAY